MSPLLLVWLAGCAPSEPLALSGATMGTTYHVKLAVGRASVDPADFQAAIDALLEEVNDQMSTYRPESELSRFNRALAGEWFAVSSATAEVVAAAQEISQVTDGAFDATVGPLVRLWHFGPPPESTAATSFHPPDDNALEEVGDRIGYQELEFRLGPPGLRKNVEGLEVDLSAIAKGYGVDRIAALLVERGIESFMVEIGGEVAARGTRPDGQPWRIGVERPTTDRRELQLAVALADAALATSGDYRNFFEDDGRRYSHIIDPTTGRPVDHTLASVTVVADTCMTADAWATALLVLGPERGYDCAEDHNLAVMFITRDDGEFDVRTTTAWQNRFGTESP